MIVLVILGYILAALFILLTLILIVPFEFKVDAQKNEITFVKAKVLWLFGAFGFYFTKVYSQKAIMFIRIFCLKKRINISKANKKEKKVERKSKEKENSVNYMEPEFLKCALNCIKKVLNHVKPKEFAIECRLGFEDPYITGIACAVLNVFHQELKMANINVNTVFDEEVFEGKGLIQGRVVLAYMACIALRLYLSRPDKINHKPKFKEVKSNG